MPALKFCCNCIEGLLESHLPADGDTDLMHGVIKPSGAGFVAVFGEKNVALTTEKINFVTMENKKLFKNKDLSVFIFKNSIC